MRTFELGVYQAVERGSDGLKTRWELFDSARNVVSTAKVPTGALMSDIVDAIRGPHDVYSEKARLAAIERRSNTVVRIATINTAIPRVMTAKLGDFTAGVVPSYISDSHVYVIRIGSSVTLKGVRYRDSPLFKEPSELSWIAYALRDGVIAENSKDWVRPSVMELRSLFNLGGWTSYSFEEVESLLGVAPFTYIDAPTMAKNITHADWRKLCGIIGIAPTD